MTEAEAKTKWCPFVRHEGDMGGTFNRGRNDAVLNVYPENRGTTCNCIGSACMAWLWSQAEVHRLRRSPVSPEQRSSAEEPARPHGLPPSWKWNATYADEGDACWVEPIEEAKARRHGYCGVAGVPTP